MSTRDDDGRDHLREALQRTELDDKPGDSPSTIAKTERPEEPKEDTDSQQNSGQETSRQLTGQEENKGTSTTDTKSKEKDASHQEGLDMEALLTGSSVVATSGGLSTSYEEKNKEEEETSKAELAKILMQFDPLVQSKSEQGN